MPISGTYSCRGDAATGGMSVRQNPLGIDATRDVIGSLPRDFPEYNAEIPARETHASLTFKQSYQLLLVHLPMCLLRIVQAT